MLVVIAPMAACYPAIKAGLKFAPSLRFAGLRTLVGGLALLLVLVIRRKPLWPEARLVRWILPLGLVATTMTFGAMFASPAYTGAGSGRRAFRVYRSVWTNPAEKSNRWEVLKRAAEIRKRRHQAASK
jgi:hypothetical protein